MRNLSLLKFILFVFYFLSTHTPIYTQTTVNEFQKILTSTSPDSTKIRACLALSEYYFQLDSDSSLIYTQKSLDLAKNQQSYIHVFSKIKSFGITQGRKGNIVTQKSCFNQLARFSTAIKNDSLLAVSLYGVAAVEQTLGDYTKALEKTKKILELVERVNLDPRQIATIYVLQAEIYNSLEQIDKAIQYYISALKIAEENKLQDKLATSLRGLSLLHQGYGDYTKALNYAKKALEASKATNQEARVATAYLDLGTVYMDIYQQDSSSKDIQYAELAQANFELALEQAIEIQYIPLEGICYQNLGILSQKLGKFSMSLEYYQKALPIFKMVGDLGNEYRTYYNLALLHKILASNTKDIAPSTSQQHLEQTLLNATKAYKYSLNVGLVEIQLSALEILEDTYNALENYKSAYQHLKIYNTLNDSIRSAERFKIVQETEAQYQTEKNALEIELLNKENAQQATLLYSVLVGSVIILFFLIIVYLLYQQKNKANKTLANQNQLISKQKETLNKQNEEKELLLKEIHHRVKNNLQIISSLLDLQNKGIDDLKASSAIEDGQSRIKSMALIHHKLYQNEDIVSINFKEYTQQLLNQILAMSSHSSVEQVITIPETIDFDIDTAIPLGLILNELLTNACKYAFKGNDNDKIEICLLQNNAGDYQLTVQDNGEGLPKDFDFKKSRSLGLRLVRRLSKQLFGNAHYQNDNGAQFIITFKDTLSRKQTA